MQMQVVRVLCASLSTKALRELKRDGTVRAGGKRL
jgi:hypothetical protein